jgi:hypothetical protein
VYDTLYGWNDRMEPEPQMTVGDLVEDEAAFGRMDPALHQFISGNGETGPRAPRLEAVPHDWFDTPDLASRKGRT